MSRNLASFMAGFGTGYLNAEERKKDRERQEKIDKMAQEQHDWKKEEYEKNKAIDDKVAAVEGVKYVDKRSMTTDDVRKMMGGSADENAENYISDESAAHYIRNNVGAEQVASNAASFAQQGVGDLGGLKPIQEGEDVKLADPSTAKAKPAWKLLEEKAKVRLGSGVPQQEQLGYQALALAQTMKSQEAREGAAQAMRTGGINGLMKFMSDWDTDDYPVTDIRMDAGAGGYDPKGGGGTVKFFGKIGGKEVMLKEYDTSKFTKGMTLEDAVMNDVMALTDPKAMFDIRRENLKMRREDAETERQQGNVDRQFAFTEDRAKVQDEQWKLSYDAQEAQRRFDRFMTSEKFKADENYRDESLKINREELGIKRDNANGKGGESYRQNYNAALAAFDKSFGGMENTVRRGKDAANYAAATDVIGVEIMKGTPIAQAQNIARQAYDKATKDGVSVQDAYEKLRRAQSQPAAAAGANSGAALVDQLMK